MCVCVSVCLCMPVQVHGQMFTAELVMFMRTLISWILVMIFFWCPAKFTPTRLKSLKNSSRQARIHPRVNRRSIQKIFKHLLDLQVWSTSVSHLTLRSSGPPCPVTSSPPPWRAPCTGPSWWSRATRRRFDCERCSLLLHWHVPPTGWRSWDEHEEHKHSMMPGLCQAESRVRTEWKQTSASS